MEPQVTALSLHVVKSRPFLKTVNTKSFMGEKRSYQILESLQASYQELSSVADKKRLRVVFRRLAKILQSYIADI